MRAADSTLPSGGISEVPPSFKISTLPQMLLFGAAMRGASNRLGVTMHEPGEAYVGGHMKFAGYAHRCTAVPASLLPDPAPAVMDPEVP